MTPLRFARASAVLGTMLVLALAPSCADDEGAAGPPSADAAGDVLGDATGDAGGLPGDVPAAGDAPDDAGGASDPGGPGDAADADDAPGPEDAAPDDAAPGDATSPPDDAGPPPLEVPTTPGCEDLNPLYCSLPYPSDRYLAPDPGTVTGYRLALDPQAIPENLEGDPFDVTPYQKYDGFSPATHLVTLFDEPADLAGVAFHDTIDLSLEADHPTVILDRTTGERVAHWVENDARADSDAETLLYLRPASRLLPNRPYTVAIRDLDGQSGAPLAASAAFAALRDGVVTSAPSIEERREHFETVFAELEEAGVAREGLQAAWTFHTGSDEASRATLLAMRDAAVETLTPDGLGCTIDSVEEDHHGLVRRVRGTFQAPWFMSTDSPPGVIVRDEAGVPLVQKVQPVKFTAIVPHTLLASDAPGQIVTWGHGLFGQAEGTVSDKNVAKVAETSGSVIVGTDWEGMSSKNLPFLGLALLDVSNFFMVGEWLSQGMVNQIALTRNMIGTCRNLEAFARADGAPAIDPDRRYFLGGSQGSILGGTLLTLSPDISRGALIVGGAGFSFMIERSIHYDSFGALLVPAYPTRLARAVLMVLSQQIWDNAETANWLGAAKDGLPGSGPKEFIYLIAENDAQVPNLSSDIAVRLTGIPVLQGSVREPWGAEVVPGPIEGSAFVSFDVGDPDVPLGNLAPASDAGGHGSVGFTPEAQAMVQQFFATGSVELTCDGLCDLTD